MSATDVTLQIGSTIHHGWKGVQARLSLQHLAGSFNIDATDTWVEAGKRIGNPIKALQGAVLRIGGETVVTGLVDEATPFYRAGDVGLRVAGRDATARLNDCSVEKREFIDQPLSAIASALCREFGIPVKVVNFSGGKPFSRFTVDAGQTYARAIEDGCRQVGAMMWTDGLGTLMIGRPAGGRHVGTLKLGNRDQRSHTYWSMLWMRSALRVAKPGSVLIAFSDWRQLPCTTDAMQAAGWVWRGIGVWDKTESVRPQLGRFRAQAEYLVWATNGPRALQGLALPGVFRHPVNSREKVHITQKPDGLLREVIAICPDGGTVCDPFLGSGATGLAAIATGRSFIGCEISPHWFDVASKRLRAASVAIPGPVSSAAPLV